MVNPYQPTELSYDKTNITPVERSKVARVRSFLMAVGFSAFATFTGYVLVALRTTKNIDTRTQAARTQIMQSDALTLYCWAIYFGSLFLILMLLAILVELHLSRIVSRSLELIFVMIVIIGIFAAESVVAQIHVELS